MNSSAVPRVAVLLATYNGARFLREQLDSIFLQDGVQPQVFVNDDGSRDETIAILSDYVPAGLTFVSPKICGGAAPNFFHLIETAKFDAYDYVCFADQDDIWNRDKLARAIQVLNMERIGAYSSDVTSFWADGRKKYIRKSQPLRRFDHLFESGGPGNTFVLQTEIAKRLRLFLLSAPADQLSKIALHDWFIYAWCRANGIQWKIDAFSGLFYRQHDLNVIGASSGVTAVIKRVNDMRRGWYIQQIVHISEFPGMPTGNGDAKRLTNFLRAPTLRGLMFSLLNVRECRRKTSDSVILALFLITRYLKLAKF